MTDMPPENYEPPRSPVLPPPPGGYAPPGTYPPPPHGAYLPPGGYPPSYQQQGYGWSQGATASYAGFWVRVAAYLLDSLLLGIPLFVLAALLEPDQFSVSAGVGYNPGFSPILNVISTAVGVTYFMLLDGGATGQTVGKKTMSIRVVDADTFQPGVGNGRGAGRYFARILSGIPCGLGYLWMLWDPKKQTWHDKLARTCVVQV